MIERRSFSFVTDGAKFLETVVDVDRFIYKNNRMMEEMEEISMELVKEVGKIHWVLEFSVHEFLRYLSTTTMEGELQKSRESMRDISPPHSHSCYPLCKASHLLITPITAQPPRLPTSGY